MSEKRDTDRRIAELATRQHGVVGRRQLCELGIGDRAIDRRLRTGRLHPVHRGVYCVGHRVLGPNGRWLAAVLAAGRGAVLSHASAAAAWELRATKAQRVDVTVPTNGGRRQRVGIRLHRYADLRADERTTHRGIPITTPARTLLDLAATLPRRALERAVDQAQILQLFDARALAAVLEAHPARPGTPALRAVLAEHAIGTTLTKSELEERFLALGDAHGIPRPCVNQRVAGLEVDFHWPELRLVVEVDGFTYHGTRAAFERDRARDARLAAAGFRTLRFSYEQVTKRPAEILRALQRRSISSIR